jgi:hypothetical protein
MVKTIKQTTQTEKNLKKLSGARPSWSVSARNQEKELKERMSDNGIWLSPKDCASLRKWDYGIRRWKRELASGEIYVFNGTYYRKNHLEHKCKPTESMEDGIRLALRDFSARTKIEHSFDSIDNGIILLSKTEQNWVRVREVNND